MSVPQLLKMAGKVISDNSPTILTSMAVAGTITTAVLAVKATPRAIKMINDEQWKKGEDLDKAEIIRLCWKEYIPAAAVGLATITCIIASNSINLSRNAAVAGLYSLTDTAFREYRSKVATTFGEGKESRMRDDMDRERVQANQIGENTVIFSGGGDMLCYDSTCGRYFHSSAEKIKQTINTLNYRLRSEMFITLNELYSELGLPSVDIGVESGWDVDKGEITVSFSSQLESDDRPVLVMNLNDIGLRRT